MAGLPPEVESAVTAWVEAAVIGEGLCPFAAPAYRRDEVYLEALPPAHDLALTTVYRRAAQMVLHASPETTLLVDADHGLDAFGRFLTFQTLAEELLEQHFPATYVTAGFHPDYRFAEVAEDDVTHELHRSPFPILQLLRRDSVAYAKTHYDTPGILERNRRHARELGAGFFAAFRRRD